MLRNIIRQSIRLGLLIIFSEALVGFVNIEVWLVNENPYFNGADLLAWMLGIGAFVLSFKVAVTVTVPATNKAGGKHVAR